MEQTYLGGSGLVVSELCLGTMTFGGACDLEAATDIVGRYRDAGGTFFDTADVYTEGRSEEMLGAIVKPYRDDVVVATKAFGPTSAGANNQSANRKHLVKAVEASLRRLDTDYIDLYQLHAFDPTTPLEETLGTLNDLVRAGKVLYVGVSNFVGWQVERACRVQQAAGYPRLVSLQPQYSLVERYIELETLPAARANNLGVLAWSPLAAGFLTGKYEREEVTSSGRDEQARQQLEAKGRFAQHVGNIDEQGWDTLDVVRELAHGHATTPAAIALAWLRAQDGVLPIIGATRTDQLDATLPATDVALSEAELSRLSAVSAPRYGYPWDFGGGSDRPTRVLRSP